MLNNLFLCGRVHTKLLKMFLKNYGQHLRKKLMSIKYLLRRLQHKTNYMYCVNIEYHHVSKFVNLVNEHSVLRTTFCSSMPRTFGYSRKLHKSLYYKKTSSCLVLIENLLDIFFFHIIIHSVKTTNLTHYGPRLYFNKSIIHLNKKLSF